MYTQSKTGTFMYMGGTEGAAMRPAGAYKISDTRMNGMISPGILPILDASNILSQKRLEMPFHDEYRRQRVQHRDPFQPILRRGTSPMAFIDSRLGQDPRWLYDSVLGLPPGITALGFQTMGSFGAPRRQVDAVVAAANERGITVFAGSPFATGQTVAAEDGDARYILDNPDIVTVEMAPHALDVKVGIAEALYRNSIDVVRFVADGM